MAENNYPRLLLTTQQGTLKLGAKRPIDQISNDSEKSQSKVTKTSSAEKASPSIFTRPGKAFTKVNATATKSLRKLDTKNISDKEEETAMWLTSTPATSDDILTATRQALDIYTKNAEKKARTLIRDAILNGPIEGQIRHIIQETLDNAGIGKEVSLRRTVNKAVERTVVDAYTKYDKVAKTTKAHTNNFKVIAEEIEDLHKALHTQENDITKIRDVVKQDLIDLADLHSEFKKREIVFTKVRDTIRRHENDIGNVRVDVKRQKGQINHLGTIVTELEESACKNKLEDDMIIKATPLSSPKRHTKRRRNTWS
ncbi:hypothetical protein GGS21DRAFT_489627 [Xylaria nigripes]|nr:hypothetical protein GGS21DRAFT_489627 [Xylaria nigripes]